MADLSLILTKGDPNYQDLLVLDNDLVLTSDVNPSGTNPILQDVLTRLKFFLGEWFLDNTQGLPWFQQILVKNPTQSTIDAIFQNAIMNTPGILQLNTYSFTVDSATRVLSISFTAQTTNGKVNYSGSISPVTGGQT